jgi:N-acetylglucosaminyldiphosphoundecaprenol N-acetyl-beta-D-mannosaminyltransferase
MDKIVNVLTMNVSDTNLSKVVNYVGTKAITKEGSYICVSNVHMCMETFDDPTFENIVNSADLIIPDGRPISWAQKLLGSKTAEQVRGQDIMNELCGGSGKNNLNIGLYGGSSDALLKSVISNLKNSYPDIQITFAFSPPFRKLTDEEDRTVLDRIKMTEVDVLFVGIGCPKQERWMADHKNSLNCVMLGVGAAFDFIAGSKNHAPKWMQEVGLEWFFRLCCEPSRLWKRYLKQNPRFIYHFTKQLIRHKIGK